jgi:NADH dehydrogenase
LTYVVAGGGFSGVECIAEMNDFLREAVGAYHNIAERDLRRYCFSAASASCRM